MADRGRDDDQILRWVLKKAYGLRYPSADQLRNYQHWHAISRRDGFDGFEPDDWRDWPWKPVPPGVTPLVITHPEPAPRPPEPSVRGAKPAKRLPRTTNGPQPLKRDPNLLATVDQAGEIEAATRLLQRRLASAAWPYSAIEAEARTAGIPVDVLAVTANALGVVTVDGRWCLPNGNGHHVPAQPEPPPVRLSAEERAALVKARRLLREQLASGPKPDDRGRYRFR